MIVFALMHACAHVVACLCCMCVWWLCRVVLLNGCMYGYMDVCMVVCVLLICMIAWMYGAQPACMYAGIGVCHVYPYNPHLYIYMHACVYVCIRYVCICVIGCMHVLLPASPHVTRCVSWLPVCLCVSLYVCMYVCMTGYLPVYGCVYGCNAWGVYACVCIVVLCMPAFARFCFVCMVVCVCLDVLHTASMPACLCVSMCLFVYVIVYVCMCVCIVVCLIGCIYGHTYKAYKVYMHTYSQTYILDRHTHMQTDNHAIIHAYLQSW